MVEFQVHFLSPEISGKAKKVGLDFAGLPVKRRAVSKIDGCVKPLTIRQNGLSGVHPIGWKAFVFRFEVGGGEAQVFSPSVSGTDFSKNGEWSAQHGGGLR